MQNVEKSVANVVKRTTEKKSCFFFDFWSKNGGGFMIEAGNFYTKTSMFYNLEFVQGKTLKSEFAWGVEAALNKQQSLLVDYFVTYLTEIKQ